MIGGGEIVQGNVIKFVHVDIVSPEGVLLVHDLDCEVPNGTNVMVSEFCFLDFYFYFYI